MDNYNKELKKLQNDRHECCLLSKTTLFPPHNAGKNWTLALDDDGAEVDIVYCPWCGIKLPTAE